MGDNDLVKRVDLKKQVLEYVRTHIVPTVTGVLALIDDAPAVPREMSAVEYLRTMRSICEDGRNCGKCPLSYNNNGAGINCQDYAAYHPEEAVAIVEAWAKEHPERSEE